MKTLTLVLCVGAACLCAAGCSTEPKTETDRKALSYDVSGALEQFKGADQSLNDLLNRSVGYAVFPDVGKAGFIAARAYGRGEVFAHARRVGYADVTKGSVGLQAGAQTFRAPIVFLTPAQPDTFKQGKFALSADVSAVAIKSGAAAAAEHSEGVIVFVHSKGGLMAEASVGGQGFSCEAAN